MKFASTALLVLFLSAIAPASGSGLESAAYDAPLAKRLNADERGMRSYVLVILKSGPKRMPDGPQRDAMFKGHFANIQRLADTGKLAIAGPFEPEDSEHWRGLFVFAVGSVDEAKALTATDPVIVNGEMVGEYHAWYASAALMAVPQMHGTLLPPAKGDATDQGQKQK